MSKLVLPSVLKVRFKCRTTRGISDFRDWIEKWMKENDTWQWNWSSGKTEILKLYETFIEIPTVSDSSDGQFQMDVSVKTFPKSWKDWIVKLLSDASKDFDPQFVSERDRSFRPDGFSAYWTTDSD